MKSKQQIVSLQSLRALAFLDIFLSHCEIMPTATIGVSIFLVMSGFLMAYQYYERSIEREGCIKSVKFAYNRIRKLYPLHIVTLTFVAIIKAIEAVKMDIGFNSIVKSAGILLANALCVHSWIPDKSIYFSFNAVSWYLSTIVFSYFLFNLLWRKVRDIKGEMLMILAIITVAIMIIISLSLNYLVNIGLLSTNIFHGVTYVGPLYRFGDFFIGVLLGIIYVRHSETEWNRMLSSCARFYLGIVTLAVIICLVFLYSNEMIPDCIKFSLVWMPESILTVLLVSVKGGSALAKIRFLRLLGDVSGECFLIHLIVVRFIQRITTNKVLVAGIALPLTIIGSLIWRKGYLLYINYMKRGNCRERRKI